MRLRQPKFDIATPTQPNNAVYGNKIMFWLTHVRGYDK